MSVSYRYAGFTLIELLITLAVLGIALAFAIPSFQGVIRSNQLTTEANTLGSALQVARSEAVKRGEDVSLSAGGATFAAGFCVHSGATCTTTATAGTPPTPPTRIRQYDALDSTATSGVTRIIFNNMGELGNGAAVSVIISPASCASGEVNGRRRVSVGLGGHVTVSSEDCP